MWLFNVSVIKTMPFNTIYVVEDMHFKQFSTNVLNVCTAVKVTEYIRWEEWKRMASFVLVLFIYYYKNGI